MNDKATQASLILRDLKRHPRIAYQQFANDAAALKRMTDSIPHLVSFGEARYAGFLTILDWDHKLPSQKAFLRIHAYYTDVALSLALAEFKRREEQIAQRATFPEFDVPDYAGINTDESYEAEVSLDGRVSNVRLTSGWRRDVAHREARLAVQLSRKSPQFRRLKAQLKGRPKHLGDLEAVSWTPPCEIGHTDWTIDVWYLVTLDANTGRGKSFLVDIKAKKVVGTREFVVRAS